MNYSEVFHAIEAIGIDCHWSIEVHTSVRPGKAPRTEWEFYAAEGPDGTGCLIIDDQPSGEALAAAVKAAYTPIHERETVEDIGDPDDSEEWIARVPS